MSVNTGNEDVFGIGMVEFEEPNRMLIAWRRNSAFLKQYTAVLTVRSELCDVKIDGLTLTVDYGHVSEARDSLYNLIKNNVDIRPISLCFVFPFLERFEDEGAQVRVARSHKNVACLIQSACNLLN